MKYSLLNYVFTPKDLNKLVDYLISRMLDMDLIK
jgi:hypothetical protein